MPDDAVGSYRRGWKLLQEMLGPSEARRTRTAWKRLAPEFERYVLAFVAGEIWPRPGLDRRTRSLVTIAALAATGRTNALALNIRMGLRNGATPGDVMETLLHLIPYAGFPAVWEALQMAQRIFSERKKGAQ